MAAAVAVAAGCAGAGAFNSPSAFAVPKRAKRYERAWQATHMQRLLWPAHGGGTKR